MKNNNYEEFKKEFYDGILHMETYPLDAIKFSDIIVGIRQIQEKIFCIIMVMKVACANI